MFRGRCASAETRLVFLRIMSSRDHRRQVPSTKSFQESVLSTWPVAAERDLDALVEPVNVRFVPCELPPFSPSVRLMRGRHSAS